jgi:hypothetical protein
MYDYRVKYLTIYLIISENKKIIQGAGFSNWFLKDYSLLPAGFQTHVLFHFLLQV